MFPPTHIGLSSSGVKGPLIVYSLTTPITGPRACDSPPVQSLGTGIALCVHLLPYMEAGLAPFSNDEAVRPKAVALV